MTCPRCDELNLVYEIRSPREFRKAIGIVRDNIADETIRVVSHPPHLIIGQRPEFADLALGASWGDVVAYWFACNTCGARFELSVEMYHGRGGEWKPVGPEDPDDLALCE